MRSRRSISAMLASVALVMACAHDMQGGSPRPHGAVGTSPLAPFEVNLPSPNSREQLAAALRQRGFLAADAPEGTQLGESIRAFQRSAGLDETGFPDDETLRRLGIDPRSRDRSLGTSAVNQEGATGAGVSH